MLTAVENQSAKHVALSRWNDTRALQAAGHLAEIEDTEGFRAYLEALDLTERAIHRTLLATHSDSVADYATKVGELNGLRKAREVVSHIHEHARYLEERIDDGREETGS